jgi:hypothetical protein
MTWRHFLLIAVTLAMLIINGVLLGFEEVNLTSSAEGPVDLIVDPLINTSWRPDQRLSNFRAFGLPDELATRTAERAEAIHNDNERLTALLAQDEALLSTYLCPRSGVPERYMALHFLVTTRDLGGGVLERDVISFNRVLELPLQDWASTSPVPEVYEQVELTASRRGDATVMGIGAILTTREEDVFARNRPFGGVGRWSFNNLMSNEPDLEEKLIEYFALMHVLVELATKPEVGICR